MNSYIKGTIRNVYYKTDKGFMVGIFKIRETNDKELEEYLNKTITFSGNFHELIEEADYIDFIKFKCSQEEIQSIIGDTPVDIELIGKFDVNEWNGRTYPQVKIEDMEVQKTVEMDKFEFGKMNLFGI